MRIRGGGSVVPTRGASWQGVAGMLVVALATAGCSTIGGQIPASVADARGATIAFESIEGPPVPIFHKFVRDLDEEAAARQIVIVPRGSEALYRIRGYLATNAEPGTMSIAWAWDVYDANQRRAFRLSGEERVAAPRGSWAAPDDQVLRRIARSSMDQFVGFIATRTSAAPESTMPARRTSVLAAIDDFRPESAGIFRILGNVVAPLGVDGTHETAAGDVPLPPDRPMPGGPEGSALAFSNALQ
ncbi:MAG: hypothetical protein QOG83_3535 [Alphaproteobacteria bacterium]|nr:hypothetical protein [Alphaproteobacteria bacterium]